MLAQRLRDEGRTARVYGVELDGLAAREARENCGRSEFRDVISIGEGDARELRGSYDCLVCNPPFFPLDVVSPLGRRAMARQGVTLSSRELWLAVGRLSREGTVFSVIIPYPQLEGYDRLAAEQGFTPVRLCLVSTREGKPVSRALVTYRRGLPAKVAEESLVLLKGDGTRTEEYARLTGSFYL
ncbi:MAG: hypothetical protein LUC33_07315 [Prevotellaceae bacterium]|nr:hypothetical protein [Prevotellaceae bacterium]